MLKDKQEQIKKTCKDLNQELIYEFGKLCYDNNLSLIARSQYFTLFNASTHWIFVDKDIANNEYIGPDPFEYFSQFSKFDIVYDLGFDIELNQTEFDIDPGYEDPKYWRIIFDEYGYSYSEEI